MSNHYILFLVDLQNKFKPKDKDPFETACAITQFSKLLVALLLFMNKVLFEL